MRNVLLQPAGAEADEHFRQTVLKPVDKRTILGALEGAGERSRLASQYHQTAPSTRYWAIRPYT